MILRSGDLVIARDWQSGKPKNLPWGHGDVENSQGRISSTKAGGLQQGTLARNVEGCYPLNYMILFGMEE